MTHRDAKIERAKCDVAKEESHVREAEEALKYGKAKALAEYNNTVAELTGALERAQLDLRAEQAHLKALEENALDGNGDMT